MTSSALQITAVPQELVVDSRDFQWFDVESDPAGWDALVRRGRTGIFHLSAVLQAHANRHARPVGILVRRTGQPNLAIGGICRRRQQRFDTMSFPALAASETPALVKSLTQWLTSEGYTTIKLGSFGSGVEGYRLPTAAVCAERLEFPWDLRQTSEQRFRSLRSNHKRKLQKLCKESYSLRAIGRMQPELMTWLRLQWARRRGQAFSLRELVEMYRHHRMMHDSLAGAGLGHLYGLYDGDDALLSLAYMLEADGVAFYMIGASSPAGYDVNASLRLFWDLAERYAKQGFSCLHFGGVPAAAVTHGHDEHGVFRFKAGFGIEPLSRTSLSIKQ